MNDDLFIKTVKECKTMFEAFRKCGGSYKNFRKKAILLNCWKPNTGGKGVKDGPSKKSIPLNEILEGKHPTFQTYKLKIKMIKEGIIEDKCMECGWNKKPEGFLFTPCELEHIDGCPTNHLKDNLKLLCPNCHSLTKTYRFRKR